MESTASQNRCLIFWMRVRAFQRRSGRPEPQTKVRAAGRALPLTLLGLVGLGRLACTLQAQIDPVRRDLVEVGYQQAFEGHAPLSSYAYYYLNRPEFLQQTNLTLRVAAAPVYVDGELGIRGVFTPHTDLGIGVSGGGYAYTYNEVRAGKFYQSESFTGHGAGATASLYHLFNPDALIPLSAVVRGGFRYVFYERDDETAPAFRLPEDQAVPVVRAGLRWGGMEPLLSPDLAMEVSAWYEGQFRLNSGSYGYSDDRAVEAAVHLFWGRAGLIYTFPETDHRVSVTITGGGSLHPDRLSAYRLGGMLTLGSEFPFALPGYYFNELSARNFALMGGSYAIPLDPARHWELAVGGVTGNVDYTSGMEQAGNWNSGVGGSLTFNSSSQAWEVVLTYGYGIDAVRTQGRGANSVAIMVQLNLERGGLPRWKFFDRGYFLQRLKNVF
jgi:hypothetical protein